jgi:2-keto-4-pentenoate hydratase/2-oxohepta-3-ene-1,7-dioic acid hydratase in catechol pathway
MKSVYLDGDKIHPSKIVCIGRNYAGHIKELGNETPEEPVIFLKPNSAISEEIYSNKTDPIHYEAELTFVVKSGELSAVGFGLDLTKREIQSALRSKGLPWERSKAFDGSAVFSDFVTFTGHITGLRLELYINDHLVQQGGYELMMNKPQDVLDETRKFLSYEDGDLIMTGTPKGVGQVYADDRFVGKIFVKERLLVEHHWVVQ